MPDLNETAVGTARRNLRLKIENVLRNFHRNSSYPESDETETRLAYEAILRAVREERIAVEDWETMPGNSTASH